ncbi:hypothetical protein AGABI1DRAFT_83777 [Agaricus bisporus var. burnettii JB137-S8]|uniref:Uncharacterized protein n=1 Tax=Agaricus bisporus var. burnettii (strain JB137-S8 / ATCC MYA-4627 / FGSC 10392) TaxID=597362 RepID=K5XCI2_AGABU|nr:hypothetical protein AGABI2DRAFT_136022 [Agaricus bisporus var. bisporus H97]XP_007328414.1 uncharacterized protein AGABI1DRAFT_83777 [Agaricus bisporus var. burnettii JB137-S8]EKM80822.1 hypothetical protein AGABI1DRAFT_83777 [Agaricus bisporus var. burnettii JB137-S8]EKV47290.1 hypothetical protein AGABI2DRAFT_136022 [Agaricus bisporus var. bisporus H97]
MPQTLGASPSLDPVGLNVAENPSSERYEEIGMSWSHSGDSSVVGFAGTPGGRRYRQLRWI